MEVGAALLFVVAGFAFGVGAGFGFGMVWLTSSMWMDADKTQDRRRDR